jgi:8-oxo-dGTP pyrophosphatase MutT (NUDIX family)
MKPQAPGTSHAAIAARVWPAVAAARSHDPATRVPFYWCDPRRLRHEVEVGSVAPAHLPALTRWRQWLQLDAQRVTLSLPLQALADALAEMNAALRAEGLIVAWRDEPFPLYSVAGEALGVAMERAATRFWGSLTVGAHCNGFVADGGGRPQRLWIARRSPSKATDPGKLDNLIGGGVPLGQTPREAVQREGWEEAGLRAEQMIGLRPGRVVRLLRDIPEGLQREWVHVYDLPLPEGTVPRNLDGEVAEITLHPLPDALDLAAGAEMTVDASLVTLDFALRHRLLPVDAHEILSSATADLFATGGD